MKSIWLILSGCLFLSLLQAQQNRLPEARLNIPLDSIVLSDPFILADQRTSMYYMTGTGGMLWKSKDLKFWDGPYLFQTKTGRLGMIWTSWIHNVCTQGVAYSRPLSPHPPFV